MRKALNLTQQEFADRLAIKRNTLANYEVGRNEPIDAVVALICREFNVNEEWLRTGEGEMFIQKSRNDEISAFVSEILHDDTDFRQKFISVLARMTVEEWKLLEKKILEIADEVKPATATTKLYIAARDGSRIEAEVEGGLTIPEEDSEIP